MAEHINVFISSTSRDLSEYRDAVTEVVLRLGLHPIIMETFNPTDNNALQLCYDKVQEAEIFVGIYAHRYGYAPPEEVAYQLSDGSERTGDGKTSITHLEYLWALERNLPILLFVISDKDASGAPLAWPVEYIEQGDGTSSLQTFKQLIMSKHVVGFFHSPDNLASKVATGLAQVKADVRTSSVPRRDYYEHVAMPKNYIVREELQENLVSKVVRGNPVVALTGIGGIGKSVMARSLCEEEGIQSAFPNGILWATLGQTPDIAQELRRWVDRLGGTVSETSPSIEDLRQALSAVAKDRSYLFIVDDVWDIEHIQSFVIESPNSTLLFTTRSRDIAEQMNASSEGIPVMKRDEAVSLLEEWAEGKLAYTNDSLKTEIVEKVLKLALTVRIAGAQLKRKEPEKWLEEFNPESFGPSRSTLREHGPLEEIFRQALADLQEPEDAQLYTALAIFKEDELVPEVAIRKLWQELEGLSDYEAADLIEDLAQFGLLEVTGEGVDLHVRLHDLLREFISNRLTNEEKQGLHETLLSAYRQTQTGNGWHTAPDDGYLYDHLIYHLQAIDNYYEARTLFMSDDWMHTRVQTNHKRYDKFVSDLMIVWQEMAQPRLEQASHDGANNLSVFSDICRYAVIRSTINTMAGSYILPIVEKALELSYWDVDQALGIISYMPDVKNKIESYVLLLQHLDNDSDEFLHALDIVNEIVLQLPFTAPSGEFDYGDGLPFVVNILTDQMIAEHVEHILKFASDNRYQYHLNDIASRLNEQQVDLFLDRIHPVGFEEDDLLKIYNDLAPNASTEQHHMMLKFANSSPEDIKRILLIGRIAVAQTGDFQKELIHTFYEQISNQESLEWHHVKTLDSISKQLADVIPNSNSSVARFNALRWAIIAYTASKHDWQTALPALFDTYNRKDLYKEFDEWDGFPKQAIPICYPYMTTEQRKVVLESKTALGCHILKLIADFEASGKSEERVLYLLEKLLNEANYSGKYDVKAFFADWREKGYHDDEVRIIAKQIIQNEVKQSLNSSTTIREHQEKLTNIVSYLSEEDITYISQLRFFMTDYSLDELEIIVPYMNKASIDEYFEYELANQANTKILSRLFTILIPYLDRYQIDTVIDRISSMEQPSRNNVDRVITRLMLHIDSDKQGKLLTLANEKNIRLDIGEEFLVAWRNNFSKLLNYVLDQYSSKERLKALQLLSKHLSDREIDIVIEKWIEKYGQIKNLDRVPNDLLEEFLAIAGDINGDQRGQIINQFLSILSQEEISSSTSIAESKLAQYFDITHLQTHMSRILKNLLSQEEHRTIDLGVLRSSRSKALELRWRFKCLKRILPCVADTEFLDRVLDALIAEDDYMMHYSEDIIPYLTKPYIDKIFKYFIARLEELYLTYDKDENDERDTIRSMSSNEVTMSLLEYLDDSQVLQLLGLSRFKDNDWMPCAEQYIKYVTVNTLDAVFDKFAVPNSYYSDEDSLGLLAQRASQDPALYTQFANAVFKDWYSNRDERQIYAEYVNKRFLNAIFSGNWFNQFSEEKETYFLREHMKYSRSIKSLELDLAEYIDDMWSRFAIMLEIAKISTHTTKVRLVKQALLMLKTADNDDKLYRLLSWGHIADLIDCITSETKVEIVTLTKKLLETASASRVNYFPSWEFNVFGCVMKMIQQFPDAEQDDWMQLLVNFIQSRDHGSELSSQLVYMIQEMDEQQIITYKQILMNLISSLSINEELYSTYYWYYQKLQTQDEKVDLRRKILAEIHEITDAEEQFGATLQVLPLIDQQRYQELFVQCLNKVEEGQDYNTFHIHKYFIRLNLDLSEQQQSQLIEIANSSTRVPIFLANRVGEQVAEEIAQLRNIDEIYPLLKYTSEDNRDYIFKATQILKASVHVERQWLIYILEELISKNVMSETLISEITDNVIDILWQWEWGKT